ncbi:MAG: CbiM family transporter [Gemmataceae bacterium]|nr:CbiM family transporter [Gemmataceae bacterium]
MGLSLLAVHLGDVLALPWWAGGFAGLAVLLAPAMWRLKEEEVPRIGVLTAAFFVASTPHIPFLVSGVHLILNGLVGVVLGRRSPLAIAVGVALQALLLNHGGKSTIGINTCILALPAVVVGALYPLLRRVGVPAFARGFVLGGGAVAGAVGLNFVVLLFGGTDDWETLAKLVLLAHVPIVLIEGLILGVVVQYLEKVKPELLGDGRGDRASP